MIKQWLARRIARKPLLAAPEPFEKTLDRLLDGRKYRRIEGSRRAKKGHRTRRDKSFLNDPMIRSLIAYEGKSLGQAMPATLKREMRLRVMARDGRACCYCGAALQIETPDAKDYATLEHVHPSAFGGDSSFSNLKLACVSCNTKRGFRSGAIKALVLTIIAAKRLSCPESNAQPSHEGAVVI